MSLSVLGAWISATCLIPVPAKAAVLPRKPALNLKLIIFRQQAETSQDTASEVGPWSPACNNLRLALENPTGSFGQGAFTKVSCLIKRTTLAAVREQHDAGWALRMTEDENNPRMEILYLGAGEPRIEALVALKNLDKVIDKLQNPSLAADVALLLMDQLPMAGILRLPALPSLTEWKIVMASPPNLPEPRPPTYMVFTLAFDSERDLWNARPIGRIKPAPAAANGAGFILQRHLNVPHYATELVFVQDSRGRGQNREPILRKMGSIFDSLVASNDSLTSNLDVSMVGIRYGYPIMKRNTVLSRAATVGLLVAANRGPLRGARLSYEKTPTVSTGTLSGLDTSFGWSRFSIGWSLSSPLPAQFSGLLQKWDVQPRLGIFNLDSKIELTDAFGNPYSTDFKLHNTVNFGIDAGISLKPLTSWQLRGFVALDCSYGAIKKTSTSLLSLRAGLDASRDLVKIGKTQLTGLIFGVAEKNSLKRQGDAPSDKESSTAQDSVVKGVAYQLLSAGAGLGMAW